MLDIDVNEAEIIIPEDALASGRLRGNRRPSPTETFASENAPDAVTVEMWQEVRHYKGQVVERKVCALSHGADHSSLLLRRPPGEVMRASGVVLTVSNATFAPFADGLGADPIAFGESATLFRRSGDFRAGNGRSAGIRVDLEHGSPSVPGWRSVGAR